MPFGQHLCRKTVSSLLCLSVLVPLSVVAHANSEELAQTKDAFDQLWHTAAETGKRRAVLEENLAHFDQRVADAKRTLEEAKNARRDLRGKIDHQKDLIGLLQKQMDAASESRGFYQAVAASQKDDIVSFVRYVTSKHIALTENGPVAGRNVLTRLLRGSLGDSIDESLAESALLKTRQRFALQINVLVSEAQRAEERLQTVQEDLRSELGGLESQGQQLSSTVDQNATFIDNSWRIKQLNEEELKRVSQETEESNARIRSMQTSLLKINSELRDAKLSGLRAELAELHSLLQALQEKKTVYERKDQAMSFLQDAALRAFSLTMQLRNTDKKLYKRIEEDALLLQNVQTQYDALPRDASGTTLSSDAEQKERMQIALLKEQLTLMREGVPEELARDYVQKKRSASEADGARRDFAVQIADATLQLASLATQIRAKEAELSAAESSSGLEGLPPMFVWPVVGTITAGYLDPDYEAVFHVPHRAIDIAVPQATPIRVVSEGIVYAVKDGGVMGYSYILVGHQNGYASLYGHVSASFVKAGDRVLFGQIIGLTGGAPGSHGAGPMTTGSHLHLEMMKDGQHLNPLEVLPKR